VAIQYINQISSLSTFTGVDQETGDPLPTVTFSKKLWATEFAEGLTLAGLTLSWPDCTIYYQMQAYSIPAGSHAFVADATYDTAFDIWLDSSQPDALTIDTWLLDGLHDPPSPSPDTGGGQSERLAWGVAPAGGGELEIHVLRHVEEV